MARRTGYKELYEERDGDYRRLLAEHRETKRENGALSKENKALSKENDDLKSQLASHDNPNTPPSRRTFPRRKKAAPREAGGPAGKEAPARRRGGRKGHRGTTSKPAPTKLQTHAPLRCPGCANTSLTVEDVRTRDITEIPEPVRATTTRHYLVSCSCGNCGLDGIEPGTGPSGDAAVRSQTPPGGDPTERTRSRPSCTTSWTGSPAGSTPPAWSGTASGCPRAPSTMSCPGQDTAWRSQPARYWRASGARACCTQTRHPSRSTAGRSGYGYSSTPRPATPTT